MSCESQLAAGETPLYREQMQRFMVAAKDRDRPYLKSLPRGFRVRPEEVCATATELAGVRDLPSEAIEIVARSATPGVSCDVKTGDLADDEMQFTLSRSFDDLDRALLVLPFLSAQCHKNTLSLNDVPPGLEALITAIQGRLGPSASFGQALAHYRNMVETIRKDAAASFAASCMAWASRQPEEHLEETHYLALISFEPCKHAIETRQAPPRSPLPASADKDKMRSDCQMRFQQWQKADRSAPLQDHWEFLSVLANRGALPEPKALKSP
jgi:hypothetical protein